MDLDRGSDNESEFAVLIESKIHGELGEIQLNRHIRRHTGFSAKLNEVDKKWVSWKQYGPSLPPTSRRVIKQSFW